jgi:UDP-2-acetamido-2-deoxy-ribo-hexuluronate aminotransferase
VIEDAAQSLGATYKGKQSGNLSTISCTSFFPSKPLGCYGDGGACFTNDDKLAEKMRQIRIHGQDKRYHHAVLGINGRLDTLQAGVLLAKLRVFGEEVRLRDQIGARYTALLAGSNCVTPYIASDCTHIYAQYTLVVENREALIDKLTQAGIPTAVHYPVPLHEQPALSKYPHLHDVSNSKRISRQVVSLPMHPYLDEATQDYIVKMVKQSI